jgi:NAD-dependent dihydropyrimidine dehydrogenase PreA subunit/flavodoxin
MVFYFSGTGNTRWAAIKLATATHERLIDIAEEMRLMKLSHKSTIKPFVLQEDERLGFVFPVHGWRVPKLVREFVTLLQVQFTHQPFVYAICTAGDSIGNTTENLNKLIAANASLVSRGITEISSSYSLIMPESYVGLPFMDVDPQNKETRKKEQAAKELRTICEEVYNQEKGISRLTKGPIPWFFTKIVGGVFEHVLITDKWFHVTPYKCAKCGICTNVCPTKDILGGKGEMPKWLHHKDCLTCFSCYHHCPHHAIEFGNQTQKKGQYYYK